MKMAGHGYNLRSGRRRSPHSLHKLIHTTKTKPHPTQPNNTPKKLLQPPQPKPQHLFADQCQDELELPILFHHYQHNNAVFPLLIALLLYHRVIWDLWITKPILYGLFVTVISSLITYYDSFQPGIDPNFWIDSGPVQICYVVAFLNGLVTTSYFLLIESGLLS